METIYLLRNTENGKVYVGRTSKFSSRKKLHINNLRANRHPNTMLQEDFNKYGEKAFVFQPIFETKQNLTNTHLEQAFMVALKTYDNAFGYNLKDPYFFNNGKPTKKYMQLTEQLLEQS